MTTAISVNPVTTGSFAALTVGPDLLLPPGRVRATIPEVREIWAFNEHRVTLIDELEEFCRLLGRVVPVCAIWLSGSYLTDKATPGDIDAVLIIDGEQLVGLAKGARYMVSPPGLRDLAKRRKLRVDAFIMEWRASPNPDPNTSPDSEYFRSRGYWDDFWLRLRSVPKGDPSQRKCALPQRGYVEVILNGYQ